MIDNICSKKFYLFSYSGILWAWVKSYKKKPTKIQKKECGKKA